MDSYVAYDHSPPTSAKGDHNWNEHARPPLDAYRRRSPGMSRLHFFLSINFG